MHSVLSLVFQVLAKCPENEQEFIEGKQGNGEKGAATFQAARTAWEIVAFASYLKVGAFLCRLQCSSDGQ